jgi:hypothetical protein
VSVHERAVGASVEWYTPRSLFDALGLTFDLDPAAAPMGSPHCVPAVRFIRPPDDGRLEPWEGRVWLNPPYGPAGVTFIERMIDHDHGLLLVPARTETRIFQKAVRFAGRIVFLRERLHFIRPDGHQARASFASVLMAFGDDPVMMRALDLAYLGWSVYGRTIRQAAA